MNTFMMVSTKMAVTMWLLSRSARANFFCSAGAPFRASVNTSSVSLLLVDQSNSNPITICRIIEIDTFNDTITCILGKKSTNSPKQSLQCACVAVFRSHLKPTNVSTGKHLPSAAPGPIGLELQIFWLNTSLCRNRGTTVPQRPLNFGQGPTAMLNIR